MAKMKQGIFGPISGKLGPVVGATWNGIPYLRESPKKKKKKRKRTTAQLANEEKMKFVNLLLVPFHPYVGIGFQHLAIEKTAVNVAYSIMYHRAVTGVYPNLVVDYAQIVISAGNLPGLLNLEMEMVGEQVIQLIWDNGSDPRTGFDDQVMLVLYCPELALTDGFTGGAKRNSEQCLFKFDSRFIGKALEVYVSVTSLDRKRIAHSVYLGRVGGI